MRSVVLLGAGAVGRELLTQICQTRQVGGPLKVCAIIDRSGVAFSPKGFSRRTLINLAAEKANGVGVGLSAIGRLASPEESIALVTSADLEAPIIVDVTAADTATLLRTAIARGFDTVLANKLPIGSSQRAFDGLQSLARKHGRRIRCEATVGAGLPVIDTLHKLVDAGDRIDSIEGCPSGTLGYLFGEMERGSPFSDALRRAVDAGYTEPDPRVDLSGLDVARKALILARLIGFRGDLDRVSVESLVPVQLRDLSVAEFLARSREADDALRARVNGAADRGAVLRYRARVTTTTISVGVCEVPRGEPLASLSGTDNQFAFETARYRERKLVIGGPGAGVSVTAAGVYGDILALAADRSTPAHRPRSNRPSRRREPPAQPASMSVF
jgi:aspartokinase/homoserine dehydrogenase 1